MNLLIALITIGVVLVIAVYFISAWLDGGLKLEKLGKFGKFKSSQDGMDERMDEDVDEDMDRHVDEDMDRHVDEEMDVQMDEDIDEDMDEEMNPNYHELEGVDQQDDDMLDRDYQMSDSASVDDELEQESADASPYSESQQIKSVYDEHHQMEDIVLVDADDIVEAEVVENEHEEESAHPDTLAPLGDELLGDDPLGDESEDELEYVTEPQSIAYAEDIDASPISNRSDDSESIDRSMLNGLIDSSAGLDDSLAIEDEAQPDQPDQNDQPETEQTHPGGVQSGYSSKYNYPNIDGFEKISQIDYWVKLQGERDVGRESILAQYCEAKSELTKHSQILGLKTPTNNWCDLEKESEDARFGDIIVTLQLVDQKGPVSETELVKFSKLIANLAAGTGRSFAFMAPLESALQQAKAISTFVRHYESIFVVNVKAQDEGYLHGDVIDRCATQLGLERNENNYYVRNKATGKSKTCLYSLANMSDSGKFDFDNLSDFTTREVVFFTKPAVNQSPGAVFTEMVDTAKIFAERVKGHAVAPNHAGLTEEDIKQIHLSIERIAQDMEEQGMATGSDEAIRIF